MSVDKGQRIIELERQIAEQKKYIETIEDFVEDPPCWVTDDDPPDEAH